MRASLRAALAAAIVLAVAASAPAAADPVGERHLVAFDATAALRDAEHRSQVRVTVWYPATQGAVGVGHYDFLATCSAAGVAVVPVCADKAPQDPTHAAAVDMALALFDRVLGRP